MTSRSNRDAARETVTIAGNLMLAPMVAAMRLPLMASEHRGVTLLSVGDGLRFMENSLLSRYLQGLKLAGLE